MSTVSVSELIDIVGEGHVGEPEGRLADGVDGLSPKVVVAPGTAEETAAVLAWASAGKHSVLVTGAGNCLSLGNVPRGADVVLTTRWLKSVAAYEPADMTMSVQSGFLLGDLSVMLAEHGQILPLDPPGGSARTIGGVAAVGRTGPLRLGYGQPRDWVVGMQVATTAGKLVRSGGRVVKNVAGYDLNKLFVGSMGTLGVITELSLKVRPKPQTELTTGYASPDQRKLWSLARRLTDAYVLPVSAEMLSPAAFIATGSMETVDDPVLYVRVAGEEADVRQQVLTVANLAAEEGLAEAPPVPADGAQAFWSAVADLPSDGTSRMVVRVSVPPSAADAALSRAVEILRGVAGEVTWCAGPLTGTVRLLLSDLKCCKTESGAEAIAQAVNVLRGECAAMGGSAIIGRAPASVKRAVDVWGSPVGGEALMLRLKDLFDPEHILNPGRFVGGI